MDRNQAKELLPIIKAYSEGKIIQCKHKDTYEEWKDIESTYFSINNTYEYRIKPEPIYRPFLNGDECWREMRKHQPLGWVISKSLRSRHNIIEVGDFIGTSNGDDMIDYPEAFNDYIFADDTSFGIKEDQV